MSIFPVPKSTSDETLGGSAEKGMDLVLNIMKFM